MSARLGNHRVAARIAWRDLRRRPFTTLLITLLVAVPIGFSLFVAGGLRTPSTPSPMWSRPIVPEHVVGGAEASTWIGFGQAEALTAELRQGQPDLEVASLDLATGQLRSIRPGPGTELVVGEFSHPLISPRYPLAAGRYPAATGEIVLDTVLADELGDKEVGDTVDLPDLRLRATVVGVLRPTESIASPAVPWLRSNTLRQVLLPTMPDLIETQLKSELLLGRPGTLTPATTEWLRRHDPNSISTAVRSTMKSVGSAPSSTVSGQYTPVVVAYVYALGGIGLAVVAVVISAAFAIGARRQLRRNGLLAASGCPPELIERAVLWQGAWVGGAATVIAALGCLAFGAVGSRALGTGATGISPWAPLDLAVMLGLAVVACTGSAAVPAWRAKHMSVLQALAGRTPVRPLPRRNVAGGVIVAAAGIGVVYLAVLYAVAETDPTGVRTAIIGILGGVLVLAGTCLGAPAAVGAAGALGSRLRGSVHLALRSVARQRSRSAAAVAGIAAAAALTVAGATAVQASGWDRYRMPGSPDPTVVFAERSHSGGGPVPDVVADRVVARLPGWRPVELTTMSISRPDIDGRSLHRSAATAAIATPEVLDAMGVADADQERLRATGALVLDAGDPIDRLSVLTAVQGRPASVDLDAVATAAPAQHKLAGALVTSEALERAGLADAQRRTITAFVGDSPIDEGAVGDLHRINDDLSHSARRFRFRGEPEGAPADYIAFMTYGDTTDRTPLALAGLMGVAFLFTGIVVALSLALAAQDSRDERAVLSAVGASPGLLRRVAGVRAGVLALLGGLLAVPAGVLPVLAATHGQYAVQPSVPWLTIGGILVVIPLVITVLAMGGSAVAGRFRPTTGLQLADL